MRQINDHYSKLARQEGYLARSIYKLKEIQEKYQLIKKNMHILDLGAAPGSWSQYVLQILKGKGSVLAVDLKPIDFKSPFKKNFKSLTGSFKHEPIMEEIAGQGPYNLILCDAAPATSGDRFVDACKSADLARHVLMIAASHLKKDGSLVIKIFQGGDEQAVLSDLKKQFHKVKPFKPKASRDESIEIFYIGFNFKG